jgi:hypothetical protein
MDSGCPILVIPSRSDPERDAVADAWIGRGWEVHRLDRFWQPPSLDRARVRLYGGDVFCLTVAQKLRLELLSPADDALVRAKAQWLRRDLAIATLGDASGFAYPAFVKPVTPKLFAGQVYADAGSLERETSGLEPDTHVLVSEAVTFRSEVRCLMLHGRVVSAAAYEGRASLDAAGLFASAFASDADVPAALALDVGEILGRGWAVIELNPIWGAGLNGCDPHRMVDCLEVATWPAST